MNYESTMDYKVGHKGNDEGNQNAVSQNRLRNGFSKLLTEWEQRSADQADRIPTDIRVHQTDHVKLMALSKLYHLPIDELAGSLLQQALERLEAEMPYIPGSKVIRVEEGDEIYEDIGPTPRYLAAQKLVREEHNRKNK